MNPTTETVNEMADHTQTDTLHAHSRSEESVENEPRNLDRRDRGFTFVEMMVVTGTLGILSVMIATGLQQGQQFARTEMSLTAVDSKFAESIDKVRRQIAVARVDNPILDGTRVRIQVPVDHDADGVLYDSTGDVTFGYSVAGTPTLGAAAWYTFVVDQVVTETTLLLDANADGDQEDSFELGHLELQTPGASTPITGSWILQNAGDPGGDIDGDGTVDPIFSLVDTGGTGLVRLRIFAIHRVADGSFRRFGYDSSIQLRNDS